MFSTQRHYSRATQVSVLAILLAMLYGYRDIQIDDSYIFYSYAKNLANGNGYVFNIGERINATTSPLYTILLALVSIIFQYLPFLTLPLIGHIIGVIYLFFFCFFLLRSFKAEKSSIFPFVVPLVFLLNPLLLNSIGMETFLAMMLAMISIYFYIKNNFPAVSIACIIGCSGKTRYAYISSSHSQL